MRCGATGASSASGKRIVRCGKLAAIRDGSDRQTANEHPSYRRFGDELNAIFMLRSTDSRSPVTAECFDLRRECPGDAGNGCGDLALRARPSPFPCGKYTT